MDGISSDLATSRIPMFSPDGQAPMISTVPDPAIEDVEVATYRIPADRPEADGTGSWDETFMILVRVNAGGMTGLGWTYGASAAAAGARDLLAPVLTGRAAFDVPAAYEAMTRVLRNPGRQGALGYALSAVDTALWDLKARLVGMPLHRLLGAVRDGAPIYGSGGFTTYDEPTLYQQLAGWVHERHIPRVKIKIGEAAGRRVDRDLRRARQAREAIGDRVELFVDANGGYDVKQAIRVADALADLDVRWFEEPVSSDYPELLKDVRDRVRPDVTAGEYGYDLPYFRRLCQAGAVDCLQIDITRCGGVTEWLRAAAVAASFGLEVSSHGAPHLHAHVGCATPNLRHLEWFHDHVRIESMLFDGTLDPTAGVLRPDPDRPGHGLDLRTADADRYRVG